MKTQKNTRIKGDFETPYTVKNAVTKGHALTKASLLIMGLGNLAHRQIAKGLIFLIAEISYIYFMITSGGSNLYHLTRLGGKKQQEVWNEAKGIFEYVQGDNSLLFLLYGIATVFITLAFLLLWRTSVRSAYKMQSLKENGKHINSFREDLKTLSNDNIINSNRWCILTDDHMLILDRKSVV